MLVYSGFGRFATDSWVILASYPRRASAAAAGAGRARRSRSASRHTRPTYAALTAFSVSNSLLRVVG